jgi:homoserine kinase
VSRVLAVQHAAQFAEFVHALHTADAERAAQCVFDPIAEPYRRRLLPGFDEAKSALQELGTLAVGISGSGPTIFALTDDFGVARKAERWMGDHYRKNDKGFVHICRADLGGARSIE